MRQVSLNYNAGEIFGCSDDKQTWDCTMRLQDYYCTVSEKKTCNYTIDSAINMTCEDKKWIFDTIKAIGKGSLSLRLRNGTKDQFQSVTQANKYP